MYITAKLRYHTEYTRMFKLFKNKFNKFRVKRENVMYLVILYIIILSYYLNQKLK